MPDWSCNATQASAKRKYNIENAIQPGNLPGMAVYQDEKWATPLNQTAHA
jgi:hypothetical protein